MVVCPCGVMVPASGVGRARRANRGPTGCFDSPSTVTTQPKDPEDAPASVEKLAAAAAANAEPPSSIPRPSSRNSMKNKCPGKAVEDIRGDHNSRTTLALATTESGRYVGTRPLRSNRSPTPTLHRLPQKSNSSNSIRDNLSNGGGGGGNTLVGRPLTKHLPAVRTSPTSPLDNQDHHQGTQRCGPRLIKGPSATTNAVLPRQNLVNNAINQRMNDFNANQRRLIYATQLRIPATKTLTKEESDRLRRIEADVPIYENLPIRLMTTPPGHQRDGRRGGGACAFHDSTTRLTSTDDEDDDDDDDEGREAVGWTHETSFPEDASSLEADVEGADGEVIYENVRDLRRLRELRVHLPPSKTNPTSSCRASDDLAGKQTKSSMSAESPSSVDIVGKNTKSSMSAESPSSADVVGKQTKSSSSADSSADAGGSLVWLSESWKYNTIKKAPEFNIFDFEEVDVPKETENPAKKVDGKGDRKEEKQRKGGTKEKWKEINTDGKGDGERKLEMAFQKGKKKLRSKLPLFGWMSDKVNKDQEKKDQGNRDQKQYQNNDQENSQDKRIKYQEKVKAKSQDNADKVYRKKDHENKDSIYQDGADLVVKTPKTRSRVLKPDAKRVSRVQVVPEGSQDTQTLRIQSNPTAGAPLGPRGVREIPIDRANDRKDAENLQEKEGVEGERRGGIPRATTTGGGIRRTTKGPRASRGYPDMEGTFRTSRSPSISPVKSGGRRNLDQFRGEGEEDKGLRRRRREETKENEEEEEARERHKSGNMSSPLISPGQQRSSSSSSSPYTYSQMAQARRGRDGARGDGGGGGGGGRGRTAATSCSSYSSIRSSSSSSISSTSSTSSTFIPLPTGPQASSLRGKTPQNTSRGHLLLDSTLLSPTSSSSLSSSSSSSLTTVSSSTSSLDNDYHKKVKTRVSHRNPLEPLIHAPTNEQTSTHDTPVMSGIKRDLDSDQEVKSELPVAKSRLRKGNHGSKNHYEEAVTVGVVTNNRLKDEKENGKKCKENEERYDIENSKGIDIKVEQKRETKEMNGETKVISKEMQENIRETKEMSKEIKENIRETKEMSKEMKENIRETKQMNSTQMRKKRLRNRTIASKIQQQPTTPSGFQDGERQIELQGESQKERQRQTSLPKAEDITTPRSGGAPEEDVTLMDVPPEPESLTELEIRFRQSMKRSREASPMALRAASKGVSSNGRMHRDILPSPSPSCPPPAEERQNAQLQQYYSLPQLYPNTCRQEYPTANKPLERNSLSTTNQHRPYYMSDLYKAPLPGISRSRRYSQTSLIDQAVENLEFSSLYPEETQSVPTSRRNSQIASATQIQEDFLGTSFTRSSASASSPLLPPLPAGVLDCKPMSPESTLDKSKGSPSSNTQTNLGSVCILSLDFTVDCEELGSSPFKVVNITNNTTDDKDEDRIVPDSNGLEESIVGLEDSVITVKYDNTENAEDDNVSIRSGTLSIDEMYCGNDDYDTIDENACKFTSEEQHKQANHTSTLPPVKHENYTHDILADEGHPELMEDSEDFIDIDCDIQPMEALKRPLVYGYGSGPVLAKNSASFLEKRFSQMSDPLEYMGMDFTENLLYREAAEDAQRKSESCMNLRETYWDYWQVKQGIKAQAHYQGSPSISNNCSEQDLTCPSETFCYDPEVLLAHVRCPKSLEDATFKQYSAYVKSHIYDYFGNVQEALDEYGLPNAQRDWIRSQPNLLPDKSRYQQNSRNIPLDYSSEPELTNGTEGDSPYRIPPHLSSMRAPPPRPPPDPPFMRKDPSQDSGSWTYLNSSQESATGVPAGGAFPVPLPRSTSSLSHVAPYTYDPWQHLLADVTPPRTPRHSMIYASNTAVPQSASPRTGRASETKAAISQVHKSKATANMPVPKLQQQQQEKQQQPPPHGYTKKSFFPIFSKVTKSPLRKPSKSCVREDSIDVLSDLPTVHPSIQKRTHTTTSSKSSSSSSSSSSASSKDSVTTVIPASARNKGPNWLMRHFGGARSKMTAV